MPDPRVRRVRASDIDAVVGLVHELASYERAPEECHLDAAQLRQALFCDSPALFGHVAEVDGEVVGCALWFLNFSTWRGTHGIYLEDLYVRPERRGAGLGKALLTALAEECMRRGYARLEWWVLDWNAPSIAFYTSLGAQPMDEWTVFRLTDNALASLGAGGSGDPDMGASADSGAADSGAADSGAADSGAADSGAAGGSSAGRRVEAEFG